MQLTYLVLCLGLSYPVLRALYCTQRPQVYLQELIKLFFEHGWWHGITILFRMRKMYGHFETRRLTPYCKTMFRAGDQITSVLAIEIRANIIVVCGYRLDRAHDQCTIEFEREITFPEVGFLGNEYDTPRSLFEAINIYWRTLRFRDYRGRAPSLDHFEVK